MLRPTLAALAALIAVAPAAARADDAPTDAGPVPRARARLEQNDGRGAVALLEAALPRAAAADRPALLAELRRAYDLAARQAESAGDARAAEEYRDNLRILTRNAPRPAPTPSAEPVAGPAPLPAEPKPAEPPPPIKPLLESPGEAASKAPEPSAEPGAIAPATEPAAAPVEPAPTPAAPAVDVRAADAAFRAKKYDEAGRLYAELAAANKLPAERRDAWAYCRCYAVVQRINARPTSRAEWDEIHDEIEAVRQLSPKNWFGEYLRNLAADISPPTRRPSPRKVVVRGSSPDEPRPTRPAASLPPRPAPAPAPAPAARPAMTPDGWRIKETANFRILHADDALAERVAKAAEATRDEQSRRWLGANPAGAWNPKCDVYLYPTPAIYQQRTGQPADSPGFSTLGQNAGRIVARRINLRADHPNLVEAVLPHEVTHVVVADLFPAAPIPKWADEGMAVLAEPGPLQDKRVVPLGPPLTSNGRLFRLGDLMRLPDYPEGQYWDLFFAQSVSLTRYLVDKGTPTQFVRFVQESQRTGPEPALRQVYQIESLAALERDWRAHAKAASAGTAVASSTDEDVKR